LGAFSEDNGIGFALSNAGFPAGVGFEGIIGFSLCFSFTVSIK
jgi:hypothetical protein